jgi:hypothetical protein
MQKKQNQICAMGTRMGFWWVQERTTQMKKTREDRGKYETGRKHKMKEKNKEECIEYHLQ